MINKKKNTMILRQAIFLLLALVCTGFSWALPTGQPSLAPDSIRFPLYLASDSNGYVQVKYRRFGSPALTLTTSLFDKSSPVLGDEVTELRFHDLQLNQVEICQTGRLFYYLGSTTSSQKHVFVGCISDELNQNPQAIEGFQLTGLTSGTTYDVKKLYRVTASDPWVFETGNISHDAAGVIFETVSGEFKLLVHDRAVIFNTATFVKRGFMEVFDWAGNNGELDCYACPEPDEQPQLLPYDGPVALPQPENTDTPGDEIDPNPDMDTNTDIDTDTEANPTEETTPPQDSPDEIPQRPKTGAGPESQSDGFCDVSVMAGGDSHNCNVNTNIVEVNVTNNVTNIYSETGDAKSPEPDIPSETFKVAEPDISATPVNGGYELSGTSLGGCQLGAGDFIGNPGGVWQIQLLGMLILFLARFAKAEACAVRGYNPDWMIIELFWGVKKRKT